jgi:hypothetical protein
MMGMFRAVRVEAQSNHQGCPYEGGYFCSEGNGLGGRATWPR